MPTTPMRASLDWIRCSSSTVGSVIDHPPYSRLAAAGFDEWAPPAGADPPQRRHDVAVATSSARHFPADRGSAPPHAAPHRPLKPRGSYTYERRRGVE